MRRTTLPYETHLISRLATTGFHCTGTTNCQHDAYRRNATARDKAYLNRQPDKRPVWLIGTDGTNCLYWRRCGIRALSTEPGGVVTRFAVRPVSLVS